MKLEGFAFTENGWVQSYGSRYVRPPIIYGDVSRTGPITVKEFKYAQSLTEKPVKGMLTGEDHAHLRSTLLQPSSMQCWCMPGLRVDDLGAVFPVEGAAKSYGSGCRTQQDMHSGSSWQSQICILRM